MNIPQGFARGLLCFFVVFLVCSCGGGGSSPSVNNPVPSVQSLSPSSVLAGSNGFTLMISGSNFLSNSTVTWNGSSRQATYVSSSQLTIPISSSDLSASGTVSVVVANPSPGGGQASASFTINAPAVPAITSVSPNNLGAGTSAITLTVTGSGFVANSVVQWNGSARTTSYVSNTQLTVNIPASDLTNPVSSLPISVMTPSPGGGTSNTVAVAVVSPALPTITSLSPTQVVLGGPAFTLTLKGTNFVGGANVYWNGISRVTQFVSSTQLTASILVSDIALPSTTNSASITVENPTPNAGISAPATLTLLNPAPTLTSLSPASGVAGTPVVVAISGSQFLSGATVQFGNQVPPTSFNSSTSLSVTLSATVGTTTLTVSNPAPSVGPSNALTFTGTAAGAGIQQTLASADPSGNTLVVNGTGMTDASGRYFAFFDTSYNLYLRDTCLSVASSCTPTSTLIGNFSGPSSDGYLVYNVLWVSTDGGYISFQQSVYETDTVSGQADVVKTCLGLSGCTPGTVVTTVPNTNGAFMALDGRYLSYGTGSTVLSLGPTGADIYDTCYGAPPGCTPQNVASPVSSTNIDVPVSSADGRYLVYTTSKSTPTTPTLSQVILHDSCLGASPGCSPSETTVSNTATSCATPTISPDAQYIAWGCALSSSSMGLNAGYLQATCFGSPSGCSTTPSVFSSSVDGGPLGLSDGGRFVAFQGSLNGLSEIYLYDSCKGVATGCTAQTVPVSVNSGGAAANANCTLLGISSNGQYVVFQTAATNLAILPSDLTGNVAYIAPSPLF
jgi:hypothetical protein